MPSTDDYFYFQAVTLQVVAAESIIQNVLDVGVVFRFCIPRVKIYGMWVLEVQNNEGAILFYVQHDSNRPLYRQLNHNEKNMYESILWR
jgi:hypothetical protein